MANLTLTIPDGALPTLRNAAEEAGHTPDNAGVRALIAAEVRRLYRQQARLESKRQRALDTQAAQAAMAANENGIT